MDIAAMGQLQYSSALHNSQLNEARVNSGDDDKLRQACRDFESIFVKQMLDSMRKTVQKTGLTDGGYAEELYQDMLYDEYARKITDTASLGVAQMLYLQLAEPAGGKLL
jgi:flagellar protein FlgJ